MRAACTVMTSSPFHDPSGMLGFLTLASPERKGFYGWARSTLQKSRSRFLCGSRVGHIDGRDQPLVPLFLTLALLERTLMALAAWVTKPSPTDHHPPEHYASLLLVPVLAVFLAMATRSRSGRVD